MHFNRVLPCSPLGLHAPQGRRGAGGATPAPRALGRPRRLVPLRASPARPGGLRASPARPGGSGHLQLGAQQPPCAPRRPPAGERVVGKGEEREKEILALARSQDQGLASRSGIVITAIVVVSFGKGQKKNKKKEKKKKGKHKKQDRFGSLSPSVPLSAFPPVHASAGFYRFFFCLRDFLRFRIIS